MIEPGHPQLSILRQCELVSISRSGFYHRPAGESPLNLELMRLIDVQFLETPWYGSRQMARHLRREGYVVGRKRVRRLMAKMGLAPIYQRPKTSVPHPEHRIWPYLLRDLAINRLDRRPTLCLPQGKGDLLVTVALALHGICPSQGSACPKIRIHPGPVPRVRTTSLKARIGPGPQTGAGPSRSCTNTQPGPPHGAGQDVATCEHSPAGAS